MTIIPDLNAVPRTDAEAAAALLQQHPDYLILRRISDAAALAAPASDDDGPLRVGISVDVETTGLNPTTDAVIEIAMQRFRFNADGIIVEVGVIRSWKQDPGFPLTAETTWITGLTDADLVGQAIDTAAATDQLRSADVIIAHNSGFDRRFVEALLPDAKKLAWGCSMSNVDWHALGFEGRSLAGLLMQMGWFYPPHRAEIDVAALLHLLAHRCEDGERVLKKLVANAECSSVRIDARNPAFEMKDAFKARGYHWDPAQKSWWVEVSEDAAESEQLWLQRAGYLRPALLTPMNWTERFL